MKILYGIQGTGHGHISRARELLPELSTHGSIDILISGYNSKMEVESCNVMRKRGLSLMYDANGSISFLETARNLQLVRFISDVNRMKLDEYELIISDFEPITAWAAHRAGRACVGMSHQASFYSERTPRPSTISTFAEKVMEKFAPTSHAIGFHFRPYDHFIEPPIVRSEILELNPSDEDHVTVYLPSFDHQTLANLFQPLTQTRFEIFSPYCESAYEKGHLLVHPIDNERFLKSVESASGVISGGGFELCSETMYLGKNLLIVPIVNQYEQLCNAAALAELGVSVVQRINAHFTDTVGYWLKHGSAVPLLEKADPKAVIDAIVNLEAHPELKMDHSSQPVLSGLFS